MLKISEIIKKYKEEKSKLQLADGGNDGISNRVAGDAAAELTTVIDKQNSDVSSTVISNVYEEVVAAVRRIYRQEIKDEGVIGPDFISDATGIIENVIRLLNMDNKSFLIMCLAEYPSREEYLYYHVANVCILSLYVGAVLQYSPSRLNELGLCALVHDIGMMDHLETINRHERLNSDEQKMIRGHCESAADILAHYGTLFSPGIIAAVHQEHERMDGSGYPSGLKGEIINEDARIIGITDVYEAMMHSRPYRLKFTSLEAIKSILENKNMFDHRLVKIFLERIGVYPVGTLVRLNTKESGMVIRGNQRLPLRPVINVLFDAMGKELVQSKPVDLAENSVLYIEEWLNEFPKKEM